MNMHLTAISALDTLWLMNYTTEFEHVKAFLSSSFDIERNLNVSLFETTIRIVGGLLSAFELSKDDFFLLKAKDLVDRLLHAFYHSPSVLPYPSINLQTGRGYVTWAREVTTLAEIGSLQLEL